MAQTAAAGGNAYQAILERIFFERSQEGADELLFDRDDIPAAAEALELPRPKNVGDVIYSVRYRTGLPERNGSSKEPEERNTSSCWFRLTASFPAPT